MSSHAYTRRLLVLFALTAVVMLPGAQVAAAAGATYPMDARDPADDSPLGATDLTPILAATGAGGEPFVEEHAFYEAQAVNSGHDPDWFRFDVSAQDVAMDYSYLFEAMAFDDSLVDPVIEIYGPHATWNLVAYTWAHTYPSGSYDALATAGDLRGDWLAAPPFESTHRGASIEFRPSVAGTYWIRVRPYGDNSGSNYYDQAGPYTFRAKISLSTRVAGADRIATAVAISQERFAEGQLSSFWGWGNLKAAIVVNGYVFPDALSASSLAGVCQGPTLLTARDQLPAETGAELQRLNPDIVYVVGGSAVVSADVISDIEALFPAPDSVSVQRIWGADRIATSVEVASKTFGLAGSTPLTPAGFVFLANARNFPDALSASSMAAGNLVPILLTDAETLDPRVEAAITAHAITDVVIVGGSAAISPGVESALVAKLGANRVLRLAGDDRYETSKVFAAWSAGFSGGGTVGTPGHPNALKVADARRIGLCTGQNFPDALAAGPFCGSDWLGSPKPLLLTRGDKLSKWVVDVYGGQLGAGETSYFDDIWSLGGTPKVGRSYLFGGTSALSDEVWWGLDSQS